MPTTPAVKQLLTPRAAIARRGPPASVAATAALVLLAGCAHVGRGPVPAPAPATPRAHATAPEPVVPRPRPAAGYDSLRDTLPAMTETLLAGRRIAIDPGHGGWFKGCIGLDGLTEAEVNLGVALELDTLLRAQGASVLLTRDRDRDFLTPADSTLKGDLAERVRRANAFAPELFVSIHHNADPGGAHDVNETQTYYKLGDDGPSYDAATDIHRALVRNVGIETQRMLPGNFAVVRGVDAPALLTESSYLTDPDVEALLRTPGARRLEALALDIGILRFFARRVPVVEWLALGRADAPSRDSVSLDPRPAFSARVRGAFDSARLVVDGAEVPLIATGGELVARCAEPLAAGPHDAALRVRFAGEGAAPVRTLRFRVNTPAARLVLETPWQGAWDQRELLAVRVRVVDASGLPWPDSLAIRLHVTQGRGVLPRDTLVFTREGIGWAYLRPRHNLGRLPVRLSAGVTGRARTGRPPLATLEIARDSLAGVRACVVRRMPSGEPLAGAPGTGGPRPVLPWINRDGVAAFPGGAPGAHSPRLPGFRAWGADSEWPPRYVEIAGGGLAGRRIVLDAEGGGDDNAGTGPSGTRAATLNLDVARALAGMLEAAGADVRLTRQGDAAVSEVERVQVAEGFRAERYLRVGHAAAPPVAGHYFASGAGRRWAHAVAGAFAELGLADSLRVGEVAKYALTQTSAIALYVSAGRVDSAASEARLLEPGARRAEAYALFLALAREFAQDPAWPVDSLLVRDVAGLPLAGAPVTLGGALVLQSGPDGMVRFAHTEPGPIEVRIDDPRAADRVRLLDSTRGRESAEPR